MVWELDLEGLPVLRRVSAGPVEGGARSPVQLQEAGSKSRSRSCSHVLTGTLVSPWGQTEAQPECSRNTPT